MVKKLMMAVAVLALATPSFAAVQNVKVGGDIVTTSIVRDNFGVGGAAARSIGRENQILAQTRLTVAADLTDNVSTAVSLLNEQLWGTASNTVGIQNAYVTLKEFMYAPLTLTVGRQPLAYGNKLIIGNAGYVAGSGYAVTGLASDLTYSTGFDAVKAVLAYEPLTIDMFAARTSSNTSNSISANSTHLNTNAYGVNANYKLGDKMSTVVEGYFFAKTVDAATQSAATATYVPGLRVSMNPIEGLNVQLEGAYQLGRITDATTGSNDNRNAFALQGGVNYALPVLKDMKPVVGAEYTYLSGKALAAAPSNGKNWDPMFQDQNAGRIFYALGMDSGVQRAALSAEITPVKDLTTKATVTGLWNVTQSPSTASKYLGSEADLDVTYAYTEDVKFGVSAGYLMTGKGIAPTADNKNASQLLSSVSVAF